MIKAVSIAEKRPAFEIVSCGHEREVPTYENQYNIHVRIPVIDNKFIRVSGLIHVFLPNFGIACNICINDRIEILYVSAGRQRVVTNHLD